MFVLGCSDEEIQCDLGEELRQHVADGAIDCGRVSQGEDSSSVDGCVVSAFQEGEPFFARYFEQGIDSQVELGVVGDENGGITFFLRDSDTSGGSDTGAVINTHTCVSPSVGTTRDRMPFSAPIRCSSIGSGERVCG